MVQQLRPVGRVCVMWSPWQNLHSLRRGDVFVRTARGMLRGTGNCSTPGAGGHSSAAACSDGGQSSGPATKRAA